MSENDDTPMKRCSKCKKWFPASVWYFDRSKQKASGLGSRCKTCSRAACQEYRSTNREKILEYNREYNKNKRPPEWHTTRPHKTKEDPVKRRKWTRKWRSKNPEIVRIWNQRYRAIRRTLEADFSVELWQKCLDWWHGCCAYCGCQRDFWHKIEQEHYISVDQGGGYAADNILPACKSCNSSKRNTPVKVWLATRFGKRKAKQILARINAYFEWIKSQE